MHPHSPRQISRQNTKSKPLPDETNFFYPLHNVQHGEPRWSINITETRSIGSLSLKKTSALIKFLSCAATPPVVMCVFPIMERLCLTFGVRFVWVSVGVWNSLNVCITANAWELATLGSILTMAWWYVGVVTGWIPKSVYVGVVVVCSACVCVCVCMVVVCICVRESSNETSVLVLWHATNILGIGMSNYSIHHLPVLCIWKYLNYGITDLRQQLFHMSSRAGWSNKMSKGKPVFIFASFSALNLPMCKPSADYIYSFDYYIYLRRLECKETPDCRW